MKVRRASQAEHTATIRQRAAADGSATVLWAISGQAPAQNARASIVAAATLEDLMIILVTTASRGRPVRTW